MRPKLNVKVQPQIEELHMRVEGKRLTQDDKFRRGTELGRRPWLRKKSSDWLSSAQEMEHGHRGEVECILEKLVAVVA